MEEKIIENVAEILEVSPEELDLDTDFRDKRFNWDSLKGFAMLVMLEEEFGIKMNVNTFIASKTIRDLLNHKM